MRPYFAVQSTNPETVEGGIVYTRICCVFSLGCFASILGERLLQATGRTVHTMITQSTGAIINIILDPIFIFGLWGVPRMEVAGAAVATVAAAHERDLAVLAGEHGERGRRKGQRSDNRDRTD